MKHLNKFNENTYVEDNKLVITLTKEEAILLRNCLARTHASGEDLDFGMSLEDKIDGFLLSSYIR